MNRFRFAIDRGGTFTDVIAFCPNNKIITLKLLSENKSAYEDAPTEAIRRIIQQESGIESMCKIDSSCIEWIRMGTTVATNALLERKGEKFCLLITKGFKDLLFIGNQSRPNLFDLSVQMPNVLYDHVIEVEERIIPLGFKDNEYSIVQSENGTKYEIFMELDRIKLNKELKDLYETKSIRNVAVLLAHSYNYTQHECEIEEIARQIGFKHISLSHKVMPMIRMVPRGLTTCIDAYLTPCVQKYIQNFLNGFVDCDTLKVLFMQSDGGLTSVNSFTGSRAIISGPAGGYVGHALTTYTGSEAIIGFDMGGTSTDVSRYDGTYEHIFESIVGGYQIQAPQLDVNTVAAGGGSRLFYKSGLFIVGPESASSNPGPTCYKKGGPLTITDANLILGRLLPEYFPQIFGPNENEPLDMEATRENFTLLAKEINDKSKTQLSVEEIALGYLNVANETMCRPIRNLTESKGYDTSKHVLACFGGAGGQHACAIAKSLGIKKVYINKYAGVLSAYGMALADITYEKQEPCNYKLNEDNMSTYILPRIEHLKNCCVEYLLSKEGISIENIHTEVYLNLRYQGTDTCIMCTSQEMKLKSFEEAFLARYKREYGFIMQNRLILVDDIRLRSIGKSGIEPRVKDIRTNETSKLTHITRKSVYFTNGYRETSIYLMEQLATNDCIQGPSIIIDRNCTILIEPECKAKLNEFGDIEIDIGHEIDEVNTIEALIQLDRIQLSIFSQRFMSIAEQMGRILQRTSISTNIKERLDFSCAMFDQTGGLVANAPHIPVHLGAMQEAVKYQIRHFESSLLDNEQLLEGDVILSNHPACGGSHLPDLTVITPVFDVINCTKKAIFYVANRGHHQDIGGLTPGSMPPTSKYLDEEGACFKSFKIVKRGEFQEEQLIEIFKQSGSRCIQDNVSDLKAQIAANNKGIELIKALIREYSLKVVQFYMKCIQNSAEYGVRALFKSLVLKNKKTLYFAREFMDDGTNLDLHVLIDERTGSAQFDFTGTSYQVFGNLNTPKAIVYSAIIYCLRSMLNYDIPLNQGCLNPLEIIIREGSILWPSDEAAVVGGNVLTSQRLVDLILKCFEVCAASQGCMNNITFGNGNYSYYETVGGGGGAGPTWHGRSGVHTHMTNTRITDPEILETRYPVVLKRFSLREHSGGRGLFKGGDGLCRDFLFRDELKLCLLTERRVFSPYGMMGGEDGKRGRNTLKTKKGHLINLGAKTIVDILPGDEFLLETPGGGGFGKFSLIDEHNNISPNNNKTIDNHAKGSLYCYKNLQESA